MKLIDLINAAHVNTYFKIIIREYGVIFESVHSAEYFLDNAKNDFLEMKVSSIDSGENSIIVTIDK